VQVTFKFTSPTPAGSRIPLMKKDKVVIMTDYAPKIFNNLRSSTALISLSLACWPCTAQGMTNLT
jgi:hypothetical protein